MPFNGNLKNRLSDLWTLWIVLSIIPWILFLLAGIFYSLSSFFERRNHTLLGKDIIWLWLLLGVPLIIQTVTMGMLLRKAQRVPAVAKFYRVCLITMTVGSFGYCGLWLSYTWGQQAQWYFSFVALFLIVVLVFTVSFITYFIMWSPAPLPEARLTEVDIYSKREALCSCLYYAKQRGQPVYLANVFDVLSEDLKANVTDAVTSKNFDEVKVPAIVKHLNEQVIEGKFFKRPEIDEIPASPNTLEMWRKLNDVPYDSSNIEQRKLVNRHLLDACLGNSHTSSLANTWIPSKWDLFCSELNTGLSHAPFQALIFFFTVFLAISYLFAFAFAFDDKAHLASTNQPALFMGRTHASGAINNRIDIEANQLARQDAPWPPYLLYVSNDGSSFSSESSPIEMDKFEEDLATRVLLLNDRTRIQKQIEGFTNQSRGSTRFKAKLLDRDSQDATKKLPQSRQELKTNTDNLKTIESEIEKQIEAWKTSRNHEHILRLARVIEDEAAQNRGIVLKLTNGLQNSPDQNSLPEGERDSAHTTVPSNTEFVSRNIYYLLSQKLVENSANLHDFNWFQPPEPGSYPRSNSSPEVSKPTNTNWEALIAEAPLVQLSEKNAALLQHEIKRLSELKEIMSQADRKILVDRLTEIIKLVQQGESNEEQHVYQDKLEDCLIMLRVFRQSIAMRGIEGWTDQTVAVSVKSLSDKHSSIPLSLMDYMYFTIYTITTTGYGDIVPTTTYAKFLCTFANILEVFFFVVFFNALLSAKKRYKPVT